MKFIGWFMALGLMTVIGACAGETPETEIEEDVPATEETEMMEEETEEPVEGTE